MTRIEFFIFAGTLTTSTALGLMTGTFISKRAAMVVAVVLAALGLLSLMQVTEISKRASAGQSSPCATERHETR